jgi:hypothetical protein
MSRASRQSNELSNDKPRFIKDMLPFLVAVALVAAAIIVSYSVASISLLGTREETLKGSRIDNSPLEDKVVGTAVSYSDSNSSPVPVQRKSPSSSDADNMRSSTPVPLSSDMPGEEIADQRTVNADGYRPLRTASEAALPTA